MSIPESNGKILLITGVNSYLGSVLGLLVLSKGYSLRGTVRNKSSIADLLDGAYAPYATRVSILEVKDMTLQGAYDEAVQGQSCYSWIVDHLKLHGLINYE